MTAAAEVAPEKWRESAPTVSFPYSFMKGETFHVTRAIEGSDNVKLLCGEGAVVYVFGGLFFRLT